MVGPGVPWHGPATMRTRLFGRGQAGQTNVEWLGVMAAIVIVVGLVAAASPPIAQNIVCKATGMMGKVFGKEWGCTTAGPNAGLPPCIVSQGDGQLKASVTVFSIKGGGKVKIIKQRRSDGKWVITVIGGGELGAVFGSPGGRLSVDTGSSEVGGGAGAEGGVVAQGEYGAAWVFDDEQRANDQIDILRNKLRDAAIDASVPVLGSIGTSLFGEDRDLGDPNIEYLQGGVAGSIEAEAKGGAAGLQGKLEGTAALGVRWDHLNKTKTIYYQLNAKGAGSAKILKGLGIEGEVEGQLAVTYNEQGEAIAADVIGKGSLSGTSPKVPLSSDPRAFLRNIKWDAKGGARGEVQLHLDLTNPSNALAWQNFRNDPFSGADDLVDAFLDNGQAQVRTYSVGKENYGIDANAKFGFKFGVEGGYEGTRADLIRAWDWDPVNGWRESASCRS